MSKQAILDRVNFPSDLRKLNDSDLNHLANELRQETITIFSKPGG